jgi:protein TonB
MLSCVIHGGLFLLVYAYFAGTKIEAAALREDVKAPLRMALTTFVEPQPVEQPKPKVEKPKKPKKIIKKEPVPVPVPIEEPVEEEEQEPVEVTPILPQVQNSGAEAVASSMAEDDNIIAIIRAAIDKEAKKDYPSKAKKMHMEGVAKVKIKIDEEGNILSLDITESSGYTMLDHSAIKSIRKASKHFPKPHKHLLFILPISYELT